MFSQTMERGLRYVHGVSSLFVPRRFPHPAVWLKAEGPGLPRCTSVLSPAQPLVLFCVFTGDSDFRGPQEPSVWAYPVTMRTSGHTSQGCTIAPWVQAAGPQS